ncbi:hypothetical protein J7M28_02905 [bacterium]|nr:hypothetical protein [bacterium]
MRRAIQIGIAIAVVYFCFSTMRPFLAQISLEMGKGWMNQSTKTAQAAGKNSARVASALRGLKMADGFFRAAINLTPSDGQVRLFLVYATNLIVDIDKSMSLERRNATHKRVIALANNAMAFYVDNIITWARGMANLRLGNVLIAIEDFETALHYYSTWSQARRAIVGSYLQQLTRNYQRAPKVLVQRLEMLVHRFPESREAVESLGKVYLNQKRYQDARECFLRAGNPSRLTPDLGLLVARTYIYERDSTRALWELCRILAYSTPKTAKSMTQVAKTVALRLKRAPKNADAQYLFGVFQQDKMSDYNVAKQYYINAFRNRMTYYFPAKRLAGVCKRLGQEDEASSWRKASERLLGVLPKLRLITPSGIKTAHCLFVREAESLSPIFGKTVQDSDASGGKAVLFSQKDGRSQPIRFDCAALPAGDYELSFRIKIPELVKSPRAPLIKLNADGEGVRCRKMGNTSNSYVLAKEVRRAGVYWDFVYSVSHPGLMPYQITVDFWAKSDIYLDRIAMAIKAD